MIYFAHAALTGLVKIGFTSDDDATARLASLETGAGPLDLLATIPGGLDVEAALHRRFELDRVHGEWFRLSVEDVGACVESIRVTRATGRLVKRGRIYHARYVLDGQTIQASTGLANRAHARRYLADRLVEVRTGAWKPTRVRRPPPTEREQLEEARRAAELEAEEMRRRPVARALESAPAETIPDVLRYIAGRVQRLPGRHSPEFRVWLAAAEGAEAALEVEGEDAR